MAAKVTASSERPSSRDQSNRYLSCALCIWEVSKEKFKNNCCCCYQLTSDSRQFQWMLFKQNSRITIAYFLIYLVFGMCIGFLGPTLEDLVCYTGEPIKSVSWAFFAQTCMMVLGIFLSGMASKWLTADFLLVISVSLLPIFFLIMSFTTTLTILTLIMALMGLAMGAIDCLTNLQLVHIYDKAVAPFLQAMHFFYGLGALISPLIADNFILNKDCSQIISSVSDDVTQPTGSNDTLTQNNTTIQDVQQKTKVYQIFWIMSAIQVPLALYTLIVVIKNGFRIKSVSPKFKRLVNTERKPILQELNEKDKKKVHEDTVKSQWDTYLSEFKGSYSISLAKAALITLAACVMVFIYDGLQGHVNEYVDTYAVKTIHGSGSDDYSLLNVCFWGAYALGRLISVLLAIKLTPYFMLLMSIAGCQVAAVVLLSSLNGSFQATIVGCLLLGLSMSSITPTTITMTEQFMDVTNLQMSLIIAGAALGEMVIPAIEGQLIDDNSGTFVILILVATIFSWLVYGIFWFMSRVTKKYRALESPSFIWYSPEKCYPEQVSTETSFNQDSSKSVVQNGSENIKTFTELSPTYEDVNLDEKPESQGDIIPQNTLDYRY